MASTLLAEASAAVKSCDLAARSASSRRCRSSASRSARMAVGTAVREAVLGRDRRDVPRLIETRDSLTHPFYGGS